MNLPLAAAAVLTVLLLAAHTILGEKLIIGPLQAVDGLPRVRGSRQFTRDTLRFAWHITSLLGFGVAVVLWLFARAGELLPRDVLMLRALSVMFGACFLTSLIGAKGRHFSWAVFLVIAVLIWVGAR